MYDSSTQPPDLDGCWMCGPYDRCETCGQLGRVEDDTPITLTDQDIARLCEAA